MYWILWMEKKKKNLNLNKERERERVTTICCTSVQFAQRKKFFSSALLHRQTAESWMRTRTAWKKSFFFFSLFVGDLSVSVHLQPPSTTTTTTTTTATIDSTSVLRFRFHSFRSLVTGVLILFRLYSGPCKRFISSALSSPDDHIHHHRPFTILEPRVLVRVILSYPIYLS